MNKTDLINIVAEVGDLKKSEAEKAVETVVIALEKALKEDGKVAIQGLGTFEVKARAAKVGTHPKTGEKITIPASKTINFKVSKALKENI